MKSLTRNQLKKLIKEEIHKILVEVEYDTGSQLDTRDTGHTDSDAVDDLVRVAKDDIKRYYQKPDYRRRVINAGIISDEDKFDQFLKSLLEEIDDTMWEFSEATERQTHKAELRYSSSGWDESYEDRLKETPVIIVNTNRIEGMSNDEMINLFIHELSHIENVLLDDYSVQYGETGQRAFKQEIGDIFISHSQLRGLRDKFDNNQEWADLVALWTQSIGPEKEWRHLPEMRARLHELRIKMGKRGETMEDVIQFSRSSSYDDIVIRYGENPAQFLLFLDYTKDLSSLADTIDVIASTSTGQRSFTG
jgi:hypothetical protein